jgi:hypothetical protein
VSRYFETEYLTEAMDRAERKRRNYPVTDIERTTTRTYRDLLTYRETGATLRELHAEGHNRFTATARREALSALISIGHVEAVNVVRHYPTTSSTRGSSRQRVLYRLTDAGVRQAQAALTDADREAVAHRRRHLGLEGGDN